MVSWMMLGILGPLLVSDDRGKHFTVAAARQRTVLAALLVRANRTVPVEELAELVWDTAPPGGAARTARTYVVRLRRAVGPAVAARIVTRDPGYRCEVAQDELDVLRFEALCRQGAAAVRARAWRQARGLLAEALGLWRGVPLEDIASQALRQECTEHLEQARLRAVEWRIEADLHLGRHLELIPELQALAGEYPLREHGHAQLMLALYRCGRAAEALEAFQRARRVLVQGLGIEPGPELRALQEKILAGDAGLAAQPRQDDEPADAARHASIVRPRQLPPAAGHFTGRAEELRILSELPARTGHTGGTVVVSAIGGMAGIGKTALAVHFGHQAAELFPDGQLYVNLAGFSPAGSPLAPGQALRGFLDALGVRPEQIPAGLDGQAGLYRSLLAGRQMLVVLDNAADEQQVRPLLPGSPGCLAVVTSRRQLAGLAAAEGAALITLDCLTEAEALQLLSARLGAGRVAAEPGAAGDLVTLCAGLPLALAIAAARGAVRPGFSLAELAAELRQAGNSLDALDAGGQGASIRPVFSWSCKALSQPAARMFRLLGLHPGPDVSVRAAASLAGLGRPAARVLLDELTCASLLTEHRPGRYALHDLLRAYAAEQAATADSGGEQRAATSRLLDHYLHSAHAARRLLGPARSLTLDPPTAGTRPEQPADCQQAMDWFAAEHQVLLAMASHAAATGSDTHAWQIPWAMEIYLDRQGHWGDLAATQLTALAAAERLGEKAGQAHLHRNIGHARFWLGSHDGARAHLSRALELYQQLGDKVGQGRIHIDLSIVSGDLGCFREYLGHARQALRLFQEAGDQTMEAFALNAVGWSWAHLGNHGQALDACQRALELARQADNIPLESSVWDSLGYIRHQLGQHAQAITCYQNALNNRRHSGEKYHQAVTLAGLGDAWHTSGDLDAARGAWREALIILDDLGHHDAAQLRAKMASIGPGPRISLNQP
jgi:DNA-binding SARP family transcriptional activator